MGKVFSWSGKQKGPYVIEEEKIGFVSRKSERTKQGTHSSKKIFNEI